MFSLPVRRETERDVVILGGLEFSVLSQHVPSVVVEVRVGAVKLNRAGEAPLRVLVPAETAQDHPEVEVCQGVLRAEFHARGKIRVCAGVVAGLVPERAPREERPEAPPVRGAYLYIKDGWNPSGVSSKALLCGSLNPDRSRSGP